MSEKTVYSSEHGDLRKKQGNKKGSGRAPLPSGMKNDGTVHVRRETKGRGGKTVTAVYGVPLSGQDLSALAARIKQKCGCGGSVKDGCVVIQGDNTGRVMEILEKEGFKVKRSGG